MQMALLKAAFKSKIMVYGCPQMAVLLALLERLQLFHSGEGTEINSCQIRIYRSNPKVELNEKTANVIFKTALPRPCLNYELTRSVDLL